ncbi:MAG: AAA family ATPase [Rhodocyclaceae bacterium]|nr:AAA family ATPase [Rhodocyclaceae bacterium]
MESLGQVFGFASALPLEPEAMPLNVKVVLVGERILYYLLKEYDPEFDELFKVGADFESDVARNEPNTRSYGRFLGMLARHYGLRPFDRHAVARMIEHSARLAGDSRNFQPAPPSLDLMQEANHHAGKDGRLTVTREYVEARSEAQRHRASPLNESMQEQYPARQPSDCRQRRTFRTVVNGLGVIDPATSCCPPGAAHRHRPHGEGDVIDIERESSAGRGRSTEGRDDPPRPFASRYAAQPAALAHGQPRCSSSRTARRKATAPRCGTCALFGAGFVPIKQSLAITGSVNQYGRRAAHRRRH